jgi:2-polyprenyl-3-methyl-5-hydroxy-6-metoxy-1,4-benzoquinol methylase
MTMQNESLTSDGGGLEALLGRLVGDVGAIYTAPLVVMGDRLGLFRALAGGEAVTSKELADATGTFERYVREWLSALAAAGYVNHEGGRFWLSPEQAMVFADPESPAFFLGAFETACAMFANREKMEAAFRSGRGLGWNEHDGMLFCGCARFFRAGYLQHLVADWLPAIKGAVAALERGAKVADVGCGYGASTVLMAKAFPKSRFHGFDYHEGSILEARRAAEEAGVADRVTFEVASATDFPGRDYDLVTTFDALHDMGDPEGAARRVRSALAPDGSWMIVEPIAGDSLEENLNPVGRIYYAASTMICTPGSVAQNLGLALGAQAGERRLGQVVQPAGFGSFRRAAETPFNIVLEARP